MDNCVSTDPSSETHKMYIEDIAKMNNITKPAMYITVKGNVPHKETPHKYILEYIKRTLYVQIVLSPRTTQA